MDAYINVISIRLEASFRDTISMNKYRTQQEIKIDTIVSILGLKAHIRAIDPPCYHIQPFNSTTTCRKTKL